MKKSIVAKVLGIALFTLMLTGISQAQVNAGIRAGVTITKLDFENDNSGHSIKSKLNADIALVSDFHLGSMFSISPEIHWMQKGSKGIKENATEVIRSLNYLEIPVLLKLHFGQDLGFFVFAGPSVGYLLDGTDKDGDGKTNDIDLDFYKRAELGAHIGGGVSIGPLKVDVRYIAGFSNIADFDDKNIEVRNSGFGAGVSFWF
jgi:hypothetical protein